MGNDCICKNGNSMTLKPMGIVPTSVEELWRVSKILASSNMVPRGLNKVEDIFIAAQMGLELGLYPIQAIQNIAVINGRPALWGDAVIGLVLRSGLLEYIKEEFKGTYPEDNFKAICSVRRKGFQEILAKEFSIEDAKKAGLWPGKNDSRNLSPWAKYPKRMLQMRARSWALRDSFADVLKGFYPVEEAIDIPPATEAQRTDPAVITEYLDDSPGPAKLIGEEAKQDTSIIDPYKKIHAMAVEKNNELDSPIFKSIKELDRQQKKYIARALNATGTTVDSLYTSIISDFDAFWGSFMNWIDDQRKHELKLEG